MDERKDESKQAGGYARAKALTRDERIAIARRAALARHRGNLPRTVAEGILAIGNLELPCAVLDDPDNTRVLSQNGFLKAIGRHPFASGGTGSAIDDTAPFLRPQNLKPFISEDLRRSATPILYLPRNPTAGAGGVGYGYRGTLLPDVCWVYQDAMLAGKLLPSQMHIGEAARAFLKALTNQAINDLIDRATGYDKIKAQRSIAEILEKFVAKVLQPYVPMFPSEYYEYIYRLNNWQYDSTSSKRPGIIGHWTNDIIYARLAPAVLEELKRQTPRDDRGRLKHKLFQLLTSDIGHPKLKEHFREVLALMRGARNWGEFYDFLDRSLPRFDKTLQLPFYDTQAMERLPMRRIERPKTLRRL
jgi:P63C domain